MEANKPQIGNTLYHQNSGVLFIKWYNQNK